MATIARLAVALLFCSSVVPQKVELVDGLRILEFLRAREFQAKEPEVREFLPGALKTEYGDYVWTDLAVGCSVKLDRAIAKDASSSTIYNRAFVMCRWRSRDEARQNLLRWFAACGRPRQELPAAGGYSAQEIYFREDLQTSEGTGFLEAKLLKNLGVWITVMIINPPGSFYVS